MKKSMIVTLTKKGQTTIPKDIRDYLGIKPNDKLEFIIEHGIVELRTVSSLEANFGRVNPKTRPEEFEQIRAKFEETVAEESP